MGALRGRPLEHQTREERVSRCPGGPDLRREVHAQPLLERPEQRRADSCVGFGPDAVTRIPLTQISRMSSVFMGFPSSRSEVGTLTDGGG
jgi:hypothetical protein